MAPKKQKVEQENGANRNARDTVIEKASPKQLVAELLDNENLGQLYSTELGLDLAKSDDLFKWLCCSILFSSGLSEALTLRACRTLLDQGLMTNAKGVQDSASESFVGALDRKYQRKEQTAKYLHSAASVILDKYDGDVFKLRESAGKSPQDIKERLKEITGLADVGVSIFFREAQLVWPELAPYIDRRAQQAAEQLGLPSEAAQLAELVGGDTKKVALLAAALTRTSLAKDKGLDQLAKGLQANGEDNGQREPDKGQSSGEDQSDTG